MTYFRDAATGLQIEQQEAYVAANPTTRTDVVTPYLSDEESEGIVRRPVYPNQPNFDTDKGITG